MDFIKRLFGGKPANTAPAVPNTGTSAPALPASTPNAITTVGGGKRRSRKQTRRNRKQSRKNSRK